MTLAFHPDETSPFVRAVLADKGIAPGEVPLEIDSRDEMLEFLLDECEGDRERALFIYFRSGVAIAETLVQVLRWRFGDLGQIELLDFASGYGRITRFLLRHFPNPEDRAERVRVSDVDPEALRFQEERLGVRGIVSAVRPEDFVCDERFDAVLVTSLFTHLSAERFAGWLRRLLGLLRPGGLLAFSVHDEAVRDPGLPMPETGLLFQETSESNSLEARDYGSAWVTERFVRSAVERAAEGPVTVWRAPRGMCGFQDLYVAVRGAGGEAVDVAGLTVHPEPLLEVDHCALERPDLLALSGWCAAPGGPPLEVQAWLDGRTVAAAPVEGWRADVAAAFGDERLTESGWVLLIPLPPGTSRSAARLLLRVVDARGVRHPLWAGSVETALFSAARQEIGGLRRELGRLRGELAGMEARAARAEHHGLELEARIAAMEASRFWKLRNAWFRLKGRFGFGVSPP